MKWLVLASAIGLVLFFSLLVFVFLHFHNSSMPQGIYIMPAVTYNQQLNKDIFDDFDNKLELNWSILGIDSSHWSLDKFPGTLTITSQAGSFERVSDDYKNVFLVDFSADQSADFQLTTCISNFKPSAIWNQAGLVIWNDKDNFVKFAYEYGEETGHGNGLLFSTGREVKGWPVYAWFIAEQTPQKTWLRIIKRNEFYELYNSTDGENFNPLKFYRSNGNLTKDNRIPILSVPIKSIGIFTSNSNSTLAPEVDASFDFFEFKILR